ncbi:MAG TPA: hypothetical protein VGN49_09145 [Micrococcaceae bacterium]|nr:hypothetical protein [Micrococcaceae bacterium]
MDRAIQTLRELPLGTRVVVRYRIDGSGPATGLVASAGSAAASSAMESDAPMGSPDRSQEPHLTDVLGFLTALDSSTCTVQAKSGDVVVILASVQAAKPVPSAPERRPRSSPGH